MRDSNSFTLRMLPKGDYMLQAGAQVENKTWAAYLPLHVASDISGLQISLAPAISIPVNISVQRTQAAPASGPVAIVVGAGGRQLRIPTLAQVLLRSIGQSQQQQYAATPQSNDGSSVAFDNLAPGSYKLSVMPFQNLYLASARYGTTDLLRDDLVVSGSAAADPIEIVLRDDGGKVKGTVTRDGQPARGALLIVPDHGTPYLPREQTTTDSGDFLLREVQPGSYSILAFDSLNDLEYANPEALDPFMSHAAHVDVIANQEASVTLEVIKRGEE